MTGRPCKSSEDVKGLWRMLLPDTPFPACGVADEARQARESGGEEISNATAELAGADVNPD